jgi:hypothetical protein
MLVKVPFDHQGPMFRCVAVQKEPAVSCPFFRPFPSHCFPEAMGGFDIHFSVYSTPFWDKFTAKETLNIKENLQRNFVLALVELLLCYS